MTHHRFQRLAFRREKYSFIININLPLPDAFSEQPKTITLVNDPSILSSFIYSTALDTYFSFFLVHGFFLIIS